MLLFFSCLAALFLPQPSAASQAPSASKNAARQSAESLLQQGKLDEAEQALWQILNDQPNDAAALRLLAEVRRKQERPSEAEALQIDPKFAEAYVSLGSLQETQKDTAKAVDAYRQALQIQPQNASAAAHLAKLLEAFGDHKASLETLHRIPSASRPADLRVVELTDLLGLKQLAKVGQWCRPSCLRLRHQRRRRWPAPTNFSNTAFRKMRSAFCDRFACEPGPAAHRSLTL